MGRYLIKRILSIVVTLFVIVTITFFLMHIIPGGPFDQDELQLNDTVLRALEAKYHLNDPIWKQYLDFLGGVLRFDLGPSYYFSGRTVTELIVSGFPVTFRLAMLSLALTIGLGIPLGVLAAVKQNSLIDRAIMFGATLGKTIPSFVMSTLLLFVFAYVLSLFPIYGAGSWRHFILPAIALSLSSIANISRLTRTSMLEVLNQDYIRTARAKGVPMRSILYRHALKNSAIPTITVLGSRIAGLLTGSFVVEKIFAMPGIGRYFVQSVGNRDYPTIMGVTIFYAVILLTSMLLVDIIYGIVDPRVRIHSRRGD